MTKTTTFPVSSILFFLLFFRMFLAMAQNSTNLVNVGVVLDFDSLFGKVGMSCIDMALSDFYASHAYYRTRMLLHTRNSMRDVVVEADAALDLIKNVEVQAMIIAPESSKQRNFVIDLGEKAHVPILSFSTSPFLTSVPSPYFFRVAQDDSSQVKAISAVVHEFGWSEAVPIYVENEFGEGVIPYLTNAFREVNVLIPYWGVIPPAATDEQIASKLYELMTMQTSVFIVHMLPSLGSRLFAKAKEMGIMAEGYVWIITDGMTNSFGSLNDSILDNMQGVLGVKTYVEKTQELENFRVRWQRKFQKDNPTILNVRLDVFGLWAYDVVWALAMAIEKVGTTTNFNFQKLNNIAGSTSNNTILESLGFSQNGPELVQALSCTIFRGLSGNFSLVNGQLQSSDFQIVNVNGNGERGIGYWMPQDGLMRNLNTTNTGTANSLGPVIWPGDTTSTPTGWKTNITKGYKLRIGVPVTAGFNELVNVANDPLTNTTMVTGYCIDVFKSLIESLPYAVSFEFYPFAQPNGELAGSYDDLIYQLYLGNYDAVVGDISNEANRSLYVDFTVPYTESGISMVMPIKNNRSSKNAWVFLKPLTWELWVISSCFFIFIGFVVWVLEHRVNEEFHGPSHHQIGTSLWFSFSTMVFAHRERVVSNLARFVVIVWCFVVLVLIQSYTASLASLLTVQQLQPDLTIGVGYRGSLVRQILIQNGIPSNKLISYDSERGLAQLFEQGIVSAAFDEKTFVEIFLSTYCSKYTTVGQKLLTPGGFAFAFQKGSPLASDVSKAITASQEQIKRIENKWFTRSCIDLNSNATSSNNLTLSIDSFGGLFLIAWISSSLALLIYAAMFLYEHRHILMRSDPNASFGTKICELLKAYNQKELSLHTIRNTGLQDSSDHGIGAVESSPNSMTDCSPTPSSDLIHADPSHSVLEMQETHTTAHGNLNANRQATQEW